MLSKSEIKRVQALFSKASFDDMEIIAKMYNDTKRLAMTKATNEFSIGQKVSFTHSKTGELVKGSIYKINRKYIIVNKAGAGFHQYRVPSSMLKAA